MDPVSITASAVAFIQAAAAIGKGVQALRSLKDLPAEIHGLSNELTALQTLVRQLQCNYVPREPEEPEANDKVINEIERLRSELSATVNDLENLLQRFAGQTQESRKLMQRRTSQLRWLKEREHVYQLSNRARQTRVSIAVFLASFASSNSFKTNGLILQVKHILQLSSYDLQHSFAENLDMSRDTNTSLQRIEDRIANMQRTQTEAMDILRSLSSTACQYNTKTNSTGATSPFNAQSSRLPSKSDRDNSTSKQDSLSCIEPYFRPTCSPTCRCQCHRRSSVASPTSLQRMLGAFFLSYNNVPVIGAVVCDFAACIAASGPSLQLHYSLPSWLILRAVVFSVSWSTMTNLGASLHLKVPRIIQARDPIWEILRCGDVHRIRQRFIARQNSPTDILANGMSLFLYTMGQSNYDVMETLLQAGCDPCVKALNGSSPAATARARVLASDVKPISERRFHLYKRIIQLDDETYYFNTSVIHDSILSLNDVTLADAIALEPQSINYLDGMGNAPLHWAVEKQKIEAISTLLSYKVDVNVKDRNHRTALHLAAHRGLIDIARLLLDAGCDLNSRDIWGITALHMACNSSSMNSTTIVQEILRRGGLPSIRGIANGFTPLHQLIWQCLARDPWDCESKIEQLLKAGADINEADKAGCTPLILASSIPWDNSLFQLLYNRGARIDVLDKNKRSILHYAAAYGDLDHIEYLRKLELTDLDPESQDFYSHTPLSLIQWRSRTEDRKLWTHMKRPCSEEMESFLLLIKEIKYRRL